MSGTLVMARLTVREAARRKLLLALLIITIVVITVTVWGFWRLFQLTLEPAGSRDYLSPVEFRAFASQILITVMFLFTFVLALSSVFTASPSIGGELESGVALAMLTRPISRAEIVLGKWLGFAVLAAVYVAGAAGVEFILVNWVTSYMPPHPFQFIAYMVGVTWTVMTFTLLLSTRVPSIAGGIIGLGAYGLAWMGGIAYSAGIVLHLSAVETAGNITRLLFPSDGLWHGAIYALEPAVIIAGLAGSGRARAANPFEATAAPPPAYLAWCVAWVVVVLGLAVWSFRTRDV